MLCFGECTLHGHFSFELNKSLYSSTMCRCQKMQEQAEWQKVTKRARVKKTLSQLIMYLRCLYMISLSLCIFARFDRGTDKVFLINFTVVECLVRVWFFFFAHCRLIKSDTKLIWYPIGNRIDARKIELTLVFGQKKNKYGLLMLLLTHSLREFQRAIQCVFCVRKQHYKCAQQHLSCHRNPVQKKKVQKREKENNKTTVANILTENERVFRWVQRIKKKRCRPKNEESEFVVYRKTAKKNALGTILWR